MHWGLVPAWLCLLAFGAQTAELPPELATLSRIKTTMSEKLSRQPNYTCIQQIERSHRRLPRRRFELHDVLRIEVALVDGKEMFAWPGAGKFEQTDLTEMVTSGAIGTGDFALHARAVFQTSAPSFKYAGGAEIQGRTATRFDFRVPLITSGYRLKAGDREATVGYHGSLWADANSYELVRLEVNADDIPPVLGIASARDVMDYGRVTIGNSDFLLPIGSELSMVDLTGNENRNRTVFKSCRQYMGESILTFAEAPAGESAAAEPAPDARAEPAEVSVEVPAQVALEIRLETEIDSENSAVGDPVTATLDQNVKTKGRILFPKGATLSGRILRLERNGEDAELDLQFSAIEFGRVRTPLLARLEEQLGFASSAAPQGMFTAIEPHRPHSGIRVRGARIHLRRGSRLRVRTVAMPLGARAK